MSVMMFMGMDVLLPVRMGMRMCMCVSVCNGMIAGLFFLRRMLTVMFMPVQIFHIVVMVFMPFVQLYIEVAGVQPRFFLSRFWQKQRQRLTASLKMRYTSMRSARWIPSWILWRLRYAWTT